MLITTTTNNTTTADHCQNNNNAGKQNPADLPPSSHKPIDTIMCLLSNPMHVRINQFYKSTTTDNDNLDMSDCDIGITGSDSTLLTTLRAI